MQPDPERQEMKLLNRAGELARTRKYANWQAVQEALKAEGFDPLAVQKALNSDEIRSSLNISCGRGRGNF